MMLFWAGLRGAVGVALAMGMKGENAVALRTTVLVTVVLTVVVFGGTIGRMIEILGIRTGVEEEEDSSDEEGYQLGGVDGDLERPSLRSKRRSMGSGIPAGARYPLSGEEDSPGGTPCRDRNSGSTRASTSRRSATLSRPNASFPRSPLASDQSVSSEDSDPDVLPAVVDVAEKEGDLTRVWRDGQWFTVLDERYLLPVFSNATASRRQASKKALRAKRAPTVDRDEPLDDDDGGSAPGSPYLSSSANQNRRQEFNGSFGDILSSLVGPALSSTPLAASSPAPLPAGYHK